jgi:hypothetical protein
MNDYPTNGTMRFAFGDEWERLNDREKEAIRHDAASILFSPDDSIEAYEKRIGRGNLRSYARCRMTIVGSRGGRGVGPFPA